MKFKSVLLLSMAVGCGLVAMLGVQQVLSGNKKHVKDTTRVLVVTADIAPGTPLDESNTTFKELPKAAVPEGAVTDPEQCKERAILVRAVPGEIVMLAKLGEKGIIGASNNIPEGMRLVSVPVDLTKSHSGMIMPGDRVDVVVTFKIRKPNVGMVTETKTVLQYIEVFAADSVRMGDVHGVEGTEIKAKNISLLVTPKQAQILTLAESKGQLRLALRRQGDDTRVDLASVDELQFNKGGTLYGEGEQESGEEDETESANTGDVRAFLKDQSDGQPAVTVTSPPNRPTWKIEVFAGDQYRVEEVELLEEQADALNVPSGLPGAGPKSAWDGWLRKVMTGA